MGNRIHVRPPGRTAIGLCAAIICVLSGAPAAIAEIFPPPGPEFEGLEISLQNDKEVYMMGDVVCVTLSVTNTSETDAWIFEGHTTVVPPPPLVPSEYPLDDFFWMSAGIWYSPSSGTAPWFIEIPASSTLERQYRWGGTILDARAPGQFTQEVTFAEHVFSNTVTVVPEPAILGVMLLGLVGLVRHRRR